MNYEELIVRRSSRGLISPISLKVAALEEGDVCCFDLADTEANRVRTVVSNRAGYIRTRYPDRKFITRIVDGKIYVARLKPEDIK